ncbi:MULTISPECIES: hypothetical protein [unclassified Sinorhizobium]|uniref:hypothetical protein n=1 Tax=unclassified Sinorhizobium TaxID=2613772 RepID=UPI0035256B3D
MKEVGALIIRCRRLHYHPPEIQFTIVLISLASMAIQRHASRSIRRRQVFRVTAGHRCHHHATICMRHRSHNAFSCITASLHFMQIFCCIPSKSIATDSSKAAAGAFVAFGGQEKTIATGGRLSAIAACAIHKYIRR